MNKLDNGIIQIEVSEHGAELQSLTKDGREYLWQGDSRYWGRRSPVLFPIVGRVWDNIYRHEGKEYSLGQHGFARDMDFRLIDSTPDSLTYELDSNEDTRRIYPFDFKLTITYTIDGDTLTVNWKIENPSMQTIAFQIGAHPAFYLPDFDPEADPRAYFRLEGHRELKYISPVEKGCVSPTLHLLTLSDDFLMPIHRDTFDCDTYIFEHSQLQKVELLSRDLVPCLTLRFTTPLVALWSPTATKPDCPFVCIEPWYGRCDRIGYDGEFTDREHMESLAPGETFEGEYTVTLH